MGKHMRIVRYKLRVPIRTGACIFLLLSLVSMFSGCKKVITVQPEFPSESRPSPDFADAAILAAKKLESRRLIYSPKSEDFRDCSGIFHRLADELRKQCPGFDGPERSFRSSRAIAGWYAARRRLVPIHNACRQDHLIRPGAVMFYGKRKNPPRNAPIKRVLPAIGHIGVVTSVNMDADGRVLSYTLFHGRSSGKPAAITNYHTRKPTRSYYHPLGNANQRWIAQAWPGPFDCMANALHRKR